MSQKFTIVIYDMLQGLMAFPVMLEEDELPIDEAKLIEKTVEIRLWRANILKDSDRFYNHERRNFTDMTAAARLMEGHQQFAENLLGDTLT